MLEFNECLHHSDLESSTTQTPFSLSLHPAGHVLGSAMARLEVHGDSLLYTGDFKLREGQSSERCEPVHARTLVMETTYGRPRYIFPPTEEVLESVLHFCRTSLDDGLTPVLISYSLGKAQEILISLLKANLPIQLHPSSARMAEIYADLGYQFPTGRCSILRPHVATLLSRRQLDRCSQPNPGWVHSESHRSVVGHWTAVGRRRTRTTNDSPSATMPTSQTSSDS